MRREYEMDNEWSKIWHEIQKDLSQTIIKDFDYYFINYI
jgi:hypothetical protein